MSTFRSIWGTVRDSYRRMFQRQEDARTRAVIETLKQVPLFQSFSRGTLRDLAEIMHQRTYKRDEFLYYEHDPGLGLYIVQEGRVRLLVEEEDGSVHDLRQVEAYEIFGDLSILGDFRRLETAQALTESRVLGFFRPDLETLIKRNPSAGVEVLLALAQHLAARQVGVVQLFTERDGKVAGMRMLHGAALRADTRHTDVPAVR